MLRLQTVITLAMLCTVLAPGQMIGVNVLLNTPPDASVLAQVEAYGTVLDVMPEINAITLHAPAENLAAIQSLPCVTTAGPDDVCELAATPTDPPPDLVAGMNLWNLDAINVTDFGSTRTVLQDGEGVYIAVIDSGLPHNWREYFPEQRIASQFARSFGGGAGNGANISEQPNKWEQSTSTHGQLIVSVLLGFKYYETPGFNGVAPRATIIPVRTYNEQDLGRESLNAYAVLYAASLKVSGALGTAPLVMNLSFGGLSPRPMLRAAIDYAIAHGVVVVAGAGNSGNAGMIYPAAYPEVISVGASGWVRQFPADDPTTIWWMTRDVPESDPLEHFIAGFSSRELPGQDLDVVAPGYMIPSAFTPSSGQVDYTFQVGTSPACPHVAGIAALMLQKNPGLTQSQIESILESTAAPLPPGCRAIADVGSSSPHVPTWSDHSNAFFFPATVCWASNATGHGLVQADAALAATPLP